MKEIKFEEVMRKIGLTIMWIVVIIMGVLLLVNPGAFDSIKDFIEKVV